VEILGRPASSIPADTRAPGESGAMPARRVPPSRRRKRPAADPASGRGRAARVQPPPRVPGRPAPLLITREIAGRPAGPVLWWSRSGGVKRVAAALAQPGLHRGEIGGVPDHRAPPTCPSTVSSPRQCPLFPQSVALLETMTADGGLTTFKPPRSLLGLLLDHPQAGIAAHRLWPSLEEWWHEW